MDTIIWIPPNLSEACTVHTTITTCQPAAFIFLQLIATILGRSKDSITHFDDTPSSNFFDFLGFKPNNHYYGAQNTKHPAKFDFIIVGAGSAGCVVANRLTEVENWKVLLLEAGDEEPEVADVPAFAPILQHSSIDWNFMTQPQSYNCLARRNGQCYWARGKVMGGSSTLNYMIYTRGTPKDYDEWAEAGNRGWSYSEVLPYFIKSEDNRNPDLIDPHYHGVGGYLSVEQFPYQDVNVRAFLKAYEELELPITDPNSPHVLGASLLQHTSRNGKRVSANVAFIRPIRKKRKNLTIQTKALVLRVLINPHTKRAYGVEYVKNGQLIKAFAKKEVIVSSGALLTPKVLMLSGIGPAHHLQEHGIKVIQDLNVGQNLQDHTTFDGLIFSLTNYTATTSNLYQEEQDLDNYIKNNPSPLSANGLVQLNAFIQSKYEWESERPDIQFNLAGLNVDDYLNDPILSYETGVTPLSYYNGLLLHVILLPPESRGFILLNSTDPLYGLPEIYPNILQKDIDILRILDGIRQGLKLVNTPSFQYLGANLVKQPLPHCSHYEFNTDNYWICVIKSYTSTIFHFAGTCKMGPETDTDAVVDPELKVYGIKNLRVIDLSVTPKIPRGNTNAPAIMIGEKGSDLIKSHWLKNEFNFFVNRK